MPDKAEDATPPKRKYLVFFEPSNPNFEDPAYVALCTELRKMGRVLCACAWIVESPLSAVGLCRFLYDSRFMVRPDKLIVSEIGPNSASENASFSV